MSDYLFNQGFQTRQDTVTEEEEQYEFVSLTAMLGHVKAELAHGTGTKYKLVAHPEGTMCGHHVFTYQELGIPGAELTSKSKRFWKLLPATEAATTSFQNTIATIQPLAEWNSKHSLKQWNRLLSSFSFPDDSTTVAYKLSRTSVRLANSIRFTLSLAGTGGTSTHKVCPQVEWFTPELQQLDARYLLPLLPDAEAKVFMLVLGRALCGASGEIPLEYADTQYKHGFRSMAIVVGKEGGLGKSELLNSIRRVMASCGYNTAVLPTKGRFGWAAPVLSDLATNDDLTAVTQKSLLTHENIKTIITGGTVRTEEKGVKGVELDARCAAIACSNYFNKLDYLDMDGGEISRANLLYSRNGRELDRLWLDKFPCGGRPVNLMPYLAEKYGVSQDCLTAYLMARSAEMFMATIGMSVEDSILVRTGKETTAETITSLREQYVYDCDMTSVPELVKTVARGVAGYIAELSDKKAEQALQKLENKKLLFSPHLLAETLKYTIRCDNHSESGKLFGLSKVVAPQVIQHMDTCLRAELVQCMNLPMEQFFQKLVAHIKDTDGISFPNKMGSYTYLLETEMREIRYLVEELKESKGLEEVDTCRDDYFVALASRI